MVRAQSMPKDQMFKLRLNADDRARLDAVAAHYALNVAGVIRMLVKREHDAIVKDGAASKPTKPRSARKGAK